MRFIILSTGIFNFWVGLVSASVFGAITNPEKTGMMVAFFALSFVIAIIHIFLDESIGKVYEPDKENPDSKKGEAISVLIGFSGICAWIFTSAMYFYVHKLWIHLGVVAGVVLVLLIFAASMFGAAAKSQQQEEEYKRWEESQNI